ncbi:MAG: FIST N-terminal domain-containing protein [Coriobacteriaceae bacterium]|nr:FIST N-terminal domain-containing protein [Coriobacteriaceae bacterium]
MKSFVATSTAATAAEAGKEVAAKIAAGIDGAKLAFAYGSADYDSKELLAAAAAGLPGTPIIGNTSFTGVITPEGFVGGDTPFVGILALGGDDVVVGTAGAARDTADCPRKIGAALAKQAMEAAGKDCAPDYWYMVASPAEEEYYIKGVTEVIGRVPFFGGSAADNEIAGKWWIYNGTECFQDGCAIAFFYTDTPFANKFTGAYAETEDFGVVTKMDGDRGIAEIDGKPALQVYADWRGMPVDQLMGGDLLVASIVSPLGFKDRLGDLIAIRHPMNGNDDLSIAVGAKVVEKTCVIRMEGDVDCLVGSVAKTAGELKEKAGAKPAAYHFVHCGGRRAAIGDRIDEVADAFIKEADGVPFIAEFTFGEYGFEDDGLNATGGLMLSFTALG